jgi:Recombination endonuclease VII
MHGCGLCDNCYTVDLKRRNPAYAARQLKASEIYRSAKSHQQKRDYQLRKYGINSQQYDVMFKNQNGMCAICGRPPKNRRLNVDHCHKTGRIRGLLCWRCNRGLGFFWNDDPVLMKKAIEYLTKGILGER